MTFIRLGGRYINLRYVIEIREQSRKVGEESVSLTLHDGSSHSGFLSDDSLAALTEQIIPAPSGYDACREYEDWFEDEPAVPALEWKPVVAFIYEPNASILEPITAEDGRLHRYAVRQPNGKLYTSHEEFFDNEDEYKASLLKSKQPT